MNYCTTKPQTTIVGDGELIHCSCCKKGFHIECAPQMKLSDICYHCDDTSLEPGVKSNKIDSKKSTKVSKSHSQMIKSRLDYFRNNCEHFTPFCTDNNCDTKEMSLCLNESPDYITGSTLRDHQLDGVNHLLSWYQRGIGGILASMLVYYCK